jgi:hypothetical protein
LPRDGLSCREISFIFLPKLISRTLPLYLFRRQLRQIPLDDLAQLVLLMPKIAGRHESNTYDDRSVAIYRSAYWTTGKEC